MMMKNNDLVHQNDNNDLNICPICYEDCSDVNIECQKCPKRFHYDCLKTAFKFAKNQKCPMCRMMNYVEFYI